jgi:Tfp pilus assembly protein PilE
MIRKNNLKNKKGQLSLFVIVALMIVVIIAAVFLIIKKPGATISATEDPQAYIRSCVEKQLVIIEKQIFDNNGYFEVSKNFMIYYGKKVPYLCRSSEFYTPCMNQEPMMIEKIRKEIDTRITKESEACFDNLLKELNRKGYATKTNATLLDIKFEGNKLIANIEKPIVAKKGEETKVYNNFATEIQSPIYLIITTSQRVVDYESALCEFNNVNWMMNFKDVSVKRFVTSDGTKVYEVKDKPSSKKINFAVRSCIFPAGI